MKNNFNSNEMLVNEIMLKIDPQYIEKTDHYITKSKEDIKWFLLFVEEAYNLNSVKLFENFMHWCYETFENYNLGRDSVDVVFEAMKDVLDSNGYKDIVEFLDQVNSNASVSDYEIEGDYLLEEQQQFIKYILDTQRQTAFDYIHDLIDKGVSIEDIYLYVFQRTLYEIGDLWQKSEITVAQEHYSIIVIQFIMTSLYEKIFDGKIKDKKLLAFSIGEELHEVGIRMIADIFEMNGWDTEYLGANLPVDAVLQFIKDNEPDLVAMSVTMPYHLNAMKKIIEAIRNEPSLAHIKILVGGRPFNQDEELYQKVGADAYSTTIKGALEIGEELLKQ